MTFHNIYSSSNLSGINVLLKEGAVSADNMSLNKNSLIFRDETIGSKTEVDYRGVLFTKDYTFLETVTTIENKMNEFGLNLSLTNRRNNIDHLSDSFIGMGDLHFLQTDEDATRHSVIFNPKEMNVSTTQFSFMNKGSVSIEGAGLTLNASSEGLKLKGDMINTSTGGYINKYLKVHIYDENTSSYLPYNIPLMSA